MTDKSEWVLGRALAAQAVANGDRPFLQFREGGPVTFGEADATANRVANGLLTLGVQPGDRVAAMLPNGEPFCQSWFGIARAGAVHVSVNTAYKGGFLAHVLSNSGARTIVLDREFLPRLAEIEEELPALATAIVPGGLARGERSPLRRVNLMAFEELMESADSPPAVEVSCRDLGEIMYTSGTTGPSKGVLMPHAHLYLFGLGTVEHLGLTRDDVYYICMPLFHANALLMQLYGSLIAGCKAVIVPAFSASGWLEEIRRHGATITNTLGVMTDYLYRQPERSEDGDHRLRAILAIPAPQEIARDFMRRFRVPLVEAYGMTEVNIPLYAHPDEPYRPGSCGRLYGTYFDVRIVDPETDEELPRGRVGEIVVRPREPFAFMAGYSGMPEKTVEAWRSFWFHTGDAGRQDDEGYFYFMDRIKDAIRRRGENISSFEIEAVLLAHPAVAEAAAVAVKSEIRGGEDEIKACIVAKPGVAIRPEALLDHCVARMPHFAVPRYVEFLEALPKTPTAKVQKAKLRSAGITPQTWDRETAGYRVRR